MPNKILKESILRSPNLSKASRLDREFFSRLLLVTDDYGCFEADPELLHSVLYPKCYDQITTQEVCCHLVSLCQYKIIFLWVEDDSLWGKFRTFEKHNRIRTKHKRKTPEEKEMNNQDVMDYLKNYADICQQMSADVSRCQQMSADVSKCQQMSANDGLNHNPNHNPNHCISKDIQCHQFQLSKIVNIYHKQLKDLAKIDIKILTPSQKNWIKKIWKDHPDLDWWNNFFENIKNMPFLLGQTPNSDWKADLLWITKPCNFAKIMVGSYLDPKKTKRKNRYDYEKYLEKSYQDYESSPKTVNLKKELDLIRMELKKEFPSTDWDDESSKGIIKNKFISKLVAKGIFLTFDVWKDKE